MCPDKISCGWWPSQNPGLLCASTALCCSQILLCSSGICCHHCPLSIFPLVPLIWLQGIAGICCPGERGAKDPPGSSLDCPQPSVKAPVRWGEGWSIHTPPHHSWAEDISWNPELGKLKITFHILARLQLDKSLKSY